MRRCLYQSLYSVLLLLWAGFFGIASSLGQTPPRTLPIIGENAWSLSISESLDFVLQAQMNPSNAEYAITQAARSGDGAYSARLKAIAAMYAPTYSTVAHVALDALWELEEPRSYYMGLARNWAQHRDLAYYAILTLARDPNPSEYEELEAIEVAAKAAGDHRLWDAIGWYETGLDLIENFHADKTLREKVENTLFWHIAGGLSSVISIEDSMVFHRTHPDGNLAPAAVWARYALRGIAQQYPDSVRAYLPTLRAELEQKYGPPPEGPIIARDFVAYVEREAFREGPVWLPPPPIDLPDLPATLVFASDSVAAAFSDKRFTLSGFDHFLTGQPSGSGNNLHAIATTTGPAKKGIKVALTNQQAKRILGIGPIPDLFKTTLSFDPAILIDELLALATDTLTATPTQNVGSLENPIIAYAPNGLTLADTFEGYGILIVDGVLKGQQRFHWKGLVIVRSRGSVPPKLKVQNNFKITGGILVYNMSALPAGLDVSGKVKLRHSAEAFQMIESSFSQALEAALLSK